MRTGIRRKVDDLGRIVIPAGIRRSLGIREGDAVEVHVEGEQVILSKPSDQCVFCRREDELHSYRSRSVCAGCIEALGLLDGTPDVPPSGEQDGEEAQEPPESTTAW